MIKIDMEMPKTCYNCPFVFSRYTKAAYPHKNDYEFSCTITKGLAVNYEMASKERLPECPLYPETATEDKDAISRRHLSEKMLEVVNAELEDTKTDKKVTADRYFFTLGRLFGLLFAEPALGELKEGAEK